MSDYTRALVTGASSGIGAAIAEEYARRGVALVLVARREDRLEALATILREEHGVEVEVLVADLTTEAGRLMTEQRLVADQKQVDVLVNNAGMVVDEAMADSDPDVRILEVELNVVSVTRLAVAAASTFRQRGRGGILNVASVTAFMPGPGAATYAAGKAYVLSLSEAMHVELAESGVRVSAVCPGFTQTDLFDEAGMDVSKVPSPMWLTPHDVARAAVDGLEANDAVVTPGSMWQALRVASRLTPTPLLRRFMPTLQKMQG